MSSSESDSRSRSLQKHSPASHDSGDLPVFYEGATFKTFEDFQTKSYQDSFNQPLVELKDYRPPKPLSLRQRRKEDWMEEVPFAHRCHVDLVKNKKVHRCHADLVKK